MRKKIAQTTIVVVFIVVNKIDDLVASRSPLAWIEVKIDLIFSYKPSGHL